jgi:hypothetical protein
MLVEPGLKHCPISVHVFWGRRIDKRLELREPCNLWRQLSAGTPLLAVSDRTHGRGASIVNRPNTQDSSGCFWQGHAAAQTHLLTYSS